MATWDELKIILARLAEASPGPLASWPGPAEDSARQPTFQIQLEPWAVEVAADLQARFGADVELTVGALRYPHRTLAGDGRLATGTAAGGRPDRDRDCAGRAVEDPFRSLRAAPPAGR